MANLWKIKDIPHKGWKLEDVIDIRDDGLSEDEAEYEACMMCGNERIRYVHIVNHPEVEDSFRVGCICAEKMTNDYVNPKLREKQLRNKANRRRNWIDKSWNISKNGNYYLRHKGEYFLIFRDKKTHKYKVKEGDIFWRKSYDTTEKAKIDIFNYLESLQ